MQGVAGNLRPEDIQGWQRWCDRFIIHNTEADLQHADPDIPLVGGLNLAHKEFRNWMAARRPFVCLNRPHIGGWADAYHCGARRASVNSYACTTFGNSSHTRWATWNLPCHDWKVKQVVNVLVAPPSKSIWYTLKVTADEWANTQSQWFAARGASTRVRSKTQSGKGKNGRYASLWADLDWADLVVSYSSAITVEAFWYGKKVISLGVCPTWTCGHPDLESWQDPVEPSDRDRWHEHVAWTQFTADEWASGQAQDMLIAYQGWPGDLKPVDNNYC